MPYIDKVTVNNTTYDIRDTTTAQEVSDLKSDLSDVQREIYGYVDIDVEYQLGRYIENGYSTAHTSYINNVQYIVSGTYDFISTLGSDYQYSLWTYVSDTQGTVKLSGRSTSAYNLSIASDVTKLTVRKMAGTPFTDEEIAFVKANLIVRKYETGSVLYPNVQTMINTSMTNAENAMLHTLSSGSANLIVEKGYYIIGASVTDLPTVSSVNMKVDYSDSSKQWLQQYLFNVIDGNAIYWRNGRNQSGVHTNNGTGLSVTWGEWKKILTEDELQAITPNAGQKIVCLGDSIFGIERGSTSIPNRIALLSGATVYNCALGGTRAGGRAGSSETITKWKNFDFVKLTESIVAGSYTSQINSLDATGVPSYFTDVFNTILPTIDFADIDIIIINYGGNDYTGGNEIGSVNGILDASTYLGGLMTGINTLMTAFPNLRIMLVSSPYKYFLSDGEFSGDSDTETFNTQNDTLGDFAKSLENLQEAMHSPLCDLYNNLGINKYNYPIWFISGDGSHPNADGRLMTAKLVCKTLSGM